MGIHLVYLEIFENRAMETDDANLALLALIPAGVRHNETMQRYQSEYECTGLQSIIELPGRNQLVGSIAHVELDELSLDVIEVRASVIRKEGGLIMSPNLGVLICKKDM
jgi:hypothetical protein